MLQLYGQTELGGIYCMQQLGEVDFDAVGKGLTSEYKMRIDNPDANGVGEIVSSHPYMFEGYYKNDEATPPICATAGCTPATPATSSPPASSSSSTA